MSERVSERVAPGVTESRNAFGFLHYIFERKKKTGVGVCVCVWLSEKKNRFISLSAVKTVRSHQCQLSEGTTSSIGSMEAYCLVCALGWLTFKAIAMLQEDFNLYQCFPTLY